MFVNVRVGRVTATPGEFFHHLPFGGENQTLTSSDANWHRRLHRSIDIDPVRGLYLKTMTAAARPIAMP